MKTGWIILLCLVLGCAYVYNTIWFQSFFLYHRFYKDIVNAPFDVTKKGESILVPLKYKYRTCYGIRVAIPDPDRRLYNHLAHDQEVGYGMLTYRFVSDGNALAEGYTHAPTERNMSYYLGVTTLTVLVFDLPFPEADDDLMLELKVVEPFAFLEPYAGNISCKINPDYLADFNKCYNDKMMIVY